MTASATTRSAPTRSYFLYLTMVIVLCVGTNILCGSLAQQLNGLLFLDTIGTAIAALAVGPWWAAIVATISPYLVSFEPCRQHAFNYLVVNVFCGLAWGYLARFWPKVFSQRDSYLRLFLNVWLFGGMVGLCSAVMSLVTTFNFVWYLSSIDPNKFRQWHLTDKYYRWLLQNGVNLQRGTLLDIIPHDIIAILPDKIISVAIACLVVYYVIPRRYINADARTSGIMGRLGLLVFVAFYGYCVYLIGTFGNVSIDISNCTINGHTVSTAQVLLWATPLSIAAWLLGGTWLGRVEPKSLTGQLAIAPPTRKYVKLVYNDVISILTGLFTLLIAIKPRSAPLSAMAEISQLLQDGLGMLAFFGLALFVPGFLMRLFEIDPEA